MAGNESSYPALEQFSLGCLHCYVSSARGALHTRGLSRPLHALERVRKPVQPLVEALTPDSDGRLHVPPPGLERWQPQGLDDLGGRKASFLWGRTRLGVAQVREVSREGSIMTLHTSEDMIHAILLLIIILILIGSSSSSSRIRIRITEGERSRYVPGPAYLQRPGWRCSSSKGPR